MTDDIAKQYDSMYTEEIERLEKQLNELKQKKSDWEAQSEDIKMAKILHDTFCHYNHADGCGWEYEKNDSYLRPKTTRNGWLIKAQALLSVIDFQTATRVIFAIKKIGMY